MPVMVLKELLCRCGDSF